MMSPQFLEFINAVLLVIFIGIELNFGHYIITGLMEYGWRVGRHQREAAIGMFVFVFGESITRASVLAWRHYENHGMITKAIEQNSTIGTSIGVMITIIGGVCVIRCFAPKALKEWPSLLTLAAALMFGVALAL